MTKKTNNLIKTDGGVVNKNINYKLETAKRKINSICTALCYQSSKYKPERTVHNIESYLALEHKLDRLLYSEISSFVYNLDMEERGTFATNLEKLLYYAMDDKNQASDDCRKLVLKFYDHFQLILRQIENTSSIIANNMEDSKESLKGEIKGIEKEYITILGIFAAIVLTFVGGITFSSSVLDNINSVSPYRLLIVIDLLALVLMNVIHLLIRFILNVNDSDSNIYDIFDICKFNIACLIFAVIVAIGWAIDASALADYIFRKCPWM